MVLNVTNQCNVSCEYCYEYGEDKIVDTENGKQSKFMSEETARQSVDFMLTESGGNKAVTTSRNRKHAISDGGYDEMLVQFRDLAYEFLEASVANRHHGVSNVKETLEELHKGVSKAFPCGAGLGLLGVATDGDVALCHRFAGADAHKFGPCTTALIATRSARFSSRTTSRTRPTAPSAGRGRSVPAAATTKRTHGTARRRGRTCTTANGFAAGPTCA